MQYIKTDTLLNVKNVGLSFKDGDNEKVILSNINFEVKDIKGAGQIVSLVGKSGSGKTQLIRRLAGLPIKNSVNTGEILLNLDKVPGKHELHQVKEGDMGIVFQDYYIPEHLKIKKMLTKAANKNLDFKNDSKLISDAVDSYINEFELNEHKDKYPIQLSGGQRQRAAICLQLLNGSNFLLLDEPLSGLDSIMIDKTVKLLQKVANSDELKTLIIVSHDLENCCSISDTVFILSKNGRPENTGATIVSEIDLLERDLAYHEDIKRMPAFHNTIQEIKNLL